MISTERHDASTTRVPAVGPGHAVVVTRYDEEKAVVISPADFHRLATLDEALDEIAAGEGIPLSALAQRGHRLEDDPGEALEEPGALEQLLES